MLSPISFTSTYKVSNQKPNTNVRFNAFKNYADKTAKSEYFTYTVFKKETTEANFLTKSEPKTQETLIVPDNLDKDVEDFCKSHGIKFEKLYTHDLMDSRKIKSRIQEAPRGYLKVDVDSAKLEEFIKTEKSNIPSLKKDYDNGLNAATRAKLLEGSDFPATILRITPPELYSNDSRVVDFVETDDKTDCYTYFALKDTGLNKIPMYVDNVTYVIGNLFGLFGLFY